MYSPTRVLHGTTNAVTHLQSAITEMTAPALSDSIISWLDDILLHHHTTDGVVQAIKDLLEVCAKHNLKLHPRKCVLFSKEIRWCGPIVSFAGIRYDPSRLEGLLSMEPPTTGFHIQQFPCALQWVKNEIPNSTDTIQPLHILMERGYTQAGKRNKRAVARIQLVAIGWGASEFSVFEKCKHALAHQVTLAHRKAEMRLCLYTDASDNAWSGMFTQVLREDLVKPHSEQRQ